MTTVINCVEIADEIKANIRQQIDELGIKVTLAVIQVEGDQASSVYVRNKHRACEACGITSRVIRLANNTTQEELLGIVEMLNADSNINGILVQLPLPEHLDSVAIIEKIAPEKDVDGLSPTNMGKLLAGNETGLKPCTPSGILEVIRKAGYHKLRGIKVAMVGASNLVGKPMAMMLTNLGATVSIYNEFTPELYDLTHDADIVILATGNAKFFYKHYFKEGCLVIDVGINRDESGKLCGDADFEDLLDHVGQITPVPKGIGVMTVAMLMRNTLEAYWLQQ